MLLSQEIDHIDVEISQLLAQVEAKKQHQTLLIELDALADVVLEQMGNIASKIKQYTPEALASLRETVLSLLGDGGTDNSQPTSPTPDTTPIPETVDCTTTKHTLDSEQKDTEKTAEPPYVELVQHPDNSALAYRRKHNGEIMCIYIGCNNHSRLKSWGEWIYRQDWGLTRQQTYAIRTALHLNFKYELKLPALPSWVLNSLAANNYSKQPIMPPEKLPLIPKVEPKIKIGDNVARNLAPNEPFEATTELGPDNKFFAKSLLDGRRELLKFDDVTLFKKVQASVKEESLAGCRTETESEFNF